MTIQLEFIQSTIIFQRPHLVARIPAINAFYVIDQRELTGPYTVHFEGASRGKNFEFNTREECEAWARADFASRITMLR